MLIRIIIALPLVFILLCVYFYSAHKAKIKKNKWLQAINSYKNSPSDKLKLVGIGVDENTDKPVEQAISKIHLKPEVRIKI